MAHSIVAKLHSHPLKRINIFAWAAVVLYIAIAWNSMCLYCRGSSGYEFTDTRLSAIIEVLWYLLPCVWLMAMFKYGRLWVKVIATLGILFVALSTCAYTACVFTRIMTDHDPCRVVIDISPVDNKTNECMYRVQSIFAGCTRIGCNETTLLPGLVQVKTTEVASLNDYWVPILPMGHR